MTYSLLDPPVRTVLDRLYAAAKGDAEIRARVGPLDQLKGTIQERADLLEEVYMPVSPEAGRLIYSLVRAARPRTLVEFGTSYGISTIHLASAVRDNGVGLVFTTELSVVKIEAATANLTEAGLASTVTVLAGDALETLRDLPQPIGFVLLDGWKELYLPLIQMLEPKLAAGALILADNTNYPATKPYLDYVRDPGNGYTGFALEGRAMELTCRV